MIRSALHGVRVARASTPSTAATRDILRRIYRETWPATYGRLLAPDVLGQMMRSLDAPGLDALLTDDREDILIASGSMPDGLVDAPVGVAIARPTTLSTGELSLLVWGFYVRPVAQNQGVGRALYNALVQLDQNVVRIDLAVLPDNLKTLGFYQHLGFTPHCARVTEILPGLSAPVIELVKHLR